MSRASGGAHCSCIAHCTLDRRTVAQIQRNIVKLGKQSTISRMFHARSNKDTIAAWMSDLDRILQVFKVRPAVPSLPLLLTIHVQTELAIHTHVAVSDTRGVVSDIHRDVANTREIVSDIHRTMVKGQERADSKNQTVSGQCILFITTNPYNLFDSGQVCDFNCISRSRPLHFNAACLENHLPLRRGPVSDGMVWLKGLLVWLTASLQLPLSVQAGLGKHLFP